MKIIYKLFIFALIFRVMPLVLLAINIFPNTALNNLDNFSQDIPTAISQGDILTIFARIVSPYNNVIKINIPGTDIGVGISISLVLSTLIIALFIVAVARSTALPTFIAGITALIIIPFIIDIGIVLYSEVSTTYDSPGLVMLFISMLVGFVGIGVITILEMAKGTDQDVSDS